MTTLTLIELGAGALLAVLSVIAIVRWPTPSAFRDPRDTAPSATKERN